MRWLLACFFLPFALYSGIDSKEDFQIWNYNVIFKKLSEKVTLQQSTEFRSGDNSQRLHYIHEEIGVVLSPKSWISIIPAYRQIWDHPRKMKWRTVASPMIDALFHFDRSNFRFTTRERFQYLIVSKAHNLALFRISGELSYFLRYPHFTARPFIRDEFFFLERNGYAQNRFAVGSFFSWGDKFTLETYYMRRYLRLPIGGWRPTNVVGIQLLFYF